MAQPLADLPILKQARSTWQSGRRELALELFERATDTHPHSVRALLECAAAMGECYRMRPACEHLEAALALARDPEVALEVAKCFAQMYRVDRAVTILEGIPGERRDPLLLAQLAVLYEQLGRFAEAKELMQRCLSSAPNAPEPILILARILGHLGEGEAALPLLQQLLDHPDSQRPRVSIQALYQLGDTLDRVGDYENALQAVTRAKRIQRTVPKAEEMAKSAFAQIGNSAEIYRQMDETVVASWLAESIDALPDDIRPAHLIGFPRSGTTLLEQPLSAHPQITTSSERLVFSQHILPEILSGTADTSAFDALCSISPSRLNELRRSYMAMMQATHDQGFAECIHLDKKPANLPFLFGLLRLLPESKFLVAVRDPRDVIVSCFMRYFPLRDLSACYLSWGTTCLIYQHYMEIWLHMRGVLPEDSWLEVWYEDVCDDFVSETSDVFAFLGLDSAPQVEQYLDVTQHQYVHSPTFAEVRRPIHRQRVSRWKNYEKQLEPFLHTLEPFVKAFGY